MINTVFSHLAFEPGQGRQTVHFCHFILPIIVTPPQLKQGQGTHSSKTASGSSSKKFSKHQAFFSLSSQGKQAAHNPPSPTASKKEKEKRNIILRKARVELFSVSTHTPSNELTNLSYLAISALGKQRLNHCAEELNVSLETVADVHG